MTISAICSDKQGKILCRTTMAAESQVLAGVPGCNWSKPNEAYSAPLSPAMAAELWGVARRAGLELKADEQFRALILDHRRILAQSAVKTAAEADLPPIPLTKTRAWHHQLQGYHFCYGLKSALLALEMGCGKSKITVDLIANRRHQRSLVVCPASVIQEWPRQFTAHCGVPILVAPLGDKVGSVKDKVAAAKLAFHEADRAGLPVVLVTNYESVWRPPFGPIYDEEGDRIVKPGFALETPWDLIVCDEIHRISSASGRASRFLAKLGPKAKYRLGLSGTPMGSGPLSVYGQYRFLDPGIFGANHKDFKEHYAVIGGFNGGQVLGHKNLEELNRKFYSIAFRVKSRDVLDLPAETHVDRKCKLCPKAREMYKKFERDLIIQIENGEVTAKNALVKLLRLQQMTSGYARLDPTADEEGETVHIDDSKKSLLREILEDIDPQQPVVVFARFTHDLAAVREVTEKLGRRYMELSGKIKQTEEWRGGGAEVLGVQIRAGGVGIDLTRSHLCIYYSLGYSLIDKLQSMARQMRPGQKHPVTYYYLISEGTVDEEVYRALSKKEDVVEAVLSMLTRHDRT